MTLADDMKRENEMLRTRLADCLFRSRNDSDLIAGMHQIIVKCGTVGGMKPQDVCREFSALKAEILGESKD